MAYTGAIAGGMLLLFFFIKWSIPVKSEPPVEEFIEINLGSSDVGMGTSQPLLPGAPAPEQASSAPAGCHCLHQFPGDRYRPHYPRDPFLRAPGPFGRLGAIAAVVQLAGDLDSSPPYPRH